MPDSGAVLLHLSPGKERPVYGFVQLPVYRRINGVQIEPRDSVRVGIRYGL